MLTLSSGLQGISGPFRFVLGPATSMGGLINLFETDPQKREIYDSWGGRYLMLSEMSVSGPSSGFPTGLFGDSAFRGELSPEDLFNTIFDEDSGLGANPGDLSFRAHGTNI